MSNQSNCTAQKATHLVTSDSIAIDFTTPLVIVNVGTSKTIFHVHKDAIIKASPFFAAALKKEWDEGNTGVVNLPEADVYSFNLYLNWIHMHGICLNIRNTSDGKEVVDLWQRMINAYALGDVFMDIDFKDTMTDTMLLATSMRDEATKKLWVPGCALRNKLYSKTAAGSKARQLIVHRIAHSAGTEKLLDKDDDCEFLLDIARSLAHGSSSGGLKATCAAAAACEFHEHETGAEHCYRSKYAKIGTIPTK